MKFRKKVIAFILIVMAFIFLNGKVFASEVENAEIMEDGILKYTDNELMPFYSTSKLKNNFIDKVNKWFASIGETLPASYRTTGLTVKDQKSTGECWAFSFTSAMEAYNLIYSGSTDIYSPRHIDYSCSNSFSSGTRKNVYTRDVEEGVGSYDLATAYATSGYGPVLEKDMPFSENLGDIPASSLDLEVQKQLEGYVIFDSVFKSYNGDQVSYFSDENCTVPFQGDINEFRQKVKKHIKNYGGVLTCIYEADFENDVLTTDNSLGVTHGVLIVGWDDNYQGEGWKKPGAYIALNSYGENNYDNGYIYISYDDVFVENCLYGITATSDVDYSKIYEHDEFGSTAGIGGKSISKSCEQTNEITSINIFDRSNVEDEFLKEVGFSSWSYQKAEIFYTESFTNNGLPKDWISLGSAGNVEPGYATFHLSTPVKLTTEKFAVAVKFTENNDENVATAAFELKLQGDEWRKNISSKQGESYVVIDKFSPTGSNTYYSVTSESASLNVCVKAYTQIGEESDPNIKVTDYKLISKIITRVPLETTVDVFKTKITCEKGYKIVDSTGKEVTSGNMKTGYKVVVDGNEYEVSVISDISGDGEGDILDLARLRSHVVGKEGYVLSGAKFYAADLSLDGKVDILDIARMRKVCVQ